MLKQKRAFLFQFSLLITVIFVLAGCAAQQKPQGGPRDLTPPKLLKATPENQTRNFKAKQIRLDFDEFFKINNPYQEISITPFMEKQPEYKTSKKSLIVDFKDSLQKNTTYVINFGKAIADVNEGNVMKNFTYVFSTGSHIDSLSISGNVINTTTQQKEKDVLVFLFPLKEDSLLFGKKKPTIFATTDSSGHFSLNNLREDTYRIYALKEPSPDKIFNNDNELIAFLKTPIVVNKDTSNIQLNLFKQVPEKFRLTERKFTTDGKLFFVFNKPLQKPSVKVVYPAALDNQKLVDINKTRDSAYVYMRNMDFDSIRVAFFDGTKALDSVSLIKGRKESFSRNLGFSYSVNRDNKVRPNAPLTITANFPIESIDPSLVTLTEDSVAVTNYTLQKDTANMRIYNLRYRWRANSKYLLVFDDGAVTDVYGDKNKRTSKSFGQDKPENYSQLTLKISVPQDSSKRSYVVELLDPNKAVLRTDVITKSGSVVYNGYVTGKYYVRVTYDNNNNGRWDSGNVKQHQYPENIWVSPKEITLRPNWEAEETLDIPREQITP